MDMIALAMAKAYSDKKGGYVERDAIVLLPEQTVTAADKRGAAYYASGIEYTPYDGGGTALFIVDGVRYEAELSSEGNGTWIGGNMGLASSANPDNGLPFCVILPQNRIYFATEGEHTVYVELPDTNHPIDPKYLPGVCLPVVKLSTTVESGATFTDVENTALNEAFEKNSPIALRCNIQMGNILATDCRLACVAFSMPNTKGISASFGAVVIEFYSNNGGAWSVNIG